MTDEGCAKVITEGDQYGTVLGAPEPDEFCPNPVEPGSEFCAEHQDEGDDYDDWFCCADCEGDYVYDLDGDDDTFEEAAA